MRWCAEERTKLYVIQGESVILSFLDHRGGKWRCKKMLEMPEMWSQMFNRRNACGVSFSRTIGTHWNSEFRLIMFELNSLIYQEDNGGSQHGDTLSACLPGRIKRNYI